MADQRQSAVYLAMLAERSERYNKTVEAMKSVALMDLELTEEERRLLSVGYKMMIGARCSTLRFLAAFERKEVSNGNHHNVRQIKDYAAKVEAELTQIHEDLVSTLRDHVIPSATSAHDHVFYHKMIGDAYRFCTEFKTGVDKEDLANHGLTAYTMGI
ncbi:general regulatory factor 11 [Perilla frutescens var. hirtella]|nr:general regulatory factor 11 [Perilla frutescens var. hirtella]